MIPFLGFSLSCVREELGHREGFELAGLVEFGVELREGEILQGQEDSMCRSASA